MTDPHTAPLDPIVELEAINHALAMCEDIVREGGRIDLAGVDEQVERLCSEVVKTEGAIRLKILPMLESAVQKLERLENRLRQTAQQEKEQMDAQMRIKAQSAYGNLQKDPPETTTKQKIL